VVQRFLAVVKYLMEYIVIYEFRQKKDRDNQRSSCRSEASANYIIGEGGGKSDTKKEEEGQIIK